jgi:cholera toxin transcriptional activator
MPPSTDPRLYRFGVFEANPRSGELRKSGVKLRLQEQPFQILLRLLQDPGAVVTREELRRQLWPADTFVDFDHSLNTAIGKLRDALEDTASAPRFLETLPKRGYRFLAPVQIVDAEGRPLRAETSPPAPPEARPSDLPTAPRPTLRSMFALLQIMYLAVYAVACARLDEISRLLDRVLHAPTLWIAVLVTAVIGIATRLYLLSAVGFDFRGLGRQVRRLFLFLLLMDTLWALSPFFLAPQIGFGAAFALCAAMLMSPFAQRTLTRMAYST